VTAILLLVFSFYCSGQADKAIRKDKFLERQLQIWIGPMFYKHPGIEFSLAYFHRSGWSFALRNLSFGYETPEYPAPAPGRFGTTYPYEYLEVTAQAGRFIALQKNFFVFAATGPSYVYNKTAAGHDTIRFTSGFFLVKTISHYKSAFGWSVSGGFGWRKGALGAIIIPGAFVNSVHSYGCVTAVITLALRVQKKRTT